MEVVAMRIGVISDTHGGTQGWRQAVAGPFVGAELILHAGDIFYHGPRNPMPPGYDPAALAQLINAAPAPVIIARGNCDSDVDQLVLDFPIQAPYALVVIEGLRIMVNHGTEFGLEDPLPGLARLAAKYKLDVLVSGHTHIPMLESVGGAVNMQSVRIWKIPPDLKRVGGSLIMNPGSPALPKLAPSAAEGSRSGEPQPTVGIIENQAARIVSLDGRTILETPIERRAAGAG
jgi:hypothetical protein